MPLLKQNIKNHEQESNHNNDSQIATLYDKETATLIKKNVAIVWGRVKNSHNLTQTGLAKALAVTQSAVSKLLKIPEDQPWKHPWTEQYLNALCKYTGVDISELIPEQNLALFTTYTEGEDVNENFLSECISAVENFYKKKGKNINGRRLADIAGKLCEKLEKSRPSQTDMENAIITILMD